MESLGGDFQIYENSGYRNERQKKQILVIDLPEGDSAGPWTEADANQVHFTVSLQEPFIIDSLCDVYLDNFTTFDAKANTDATSNHSAFVIDIDQFPIKSNTNATGLFNKLVIPNETTAQKTLKVHKGKKMNYVCQMNPQTLTQISGSVSDMSGSTMNLDSSGIPDDYTYRVIMEFLFVSRE